jgi:cation diffusion facilitator family transporter
MSNPTNTKFRWILTSFIVSISLLLVKFWGYYLTHSNAILSDALESIINVLASGFAFYSVYLSDQPRDANHPYGHGKIEYFSSGFEGALIFFAGGFIVYEAIQRLFTPEPIHELGWGIALVSISILVNGTVGYFLVKEGKKTRSEALIADGKHLLTDTYSSILIVVGLGLVAITGYQKTDSIVSIILSIVIFYNGYKLMRKAFGALMDEHDPELMKHMVDVLKKNKKDEWIDVHNLRIQKYGSDLHIDCHLTLPHYWNLSKVHESVHDFEQNIKQNTIGELELFVHTDPCLAECCGHCRVGICAVRAEAHTYDVVWDAHTLAANQKHFEQLQ